MDLPLEAMRSKLFPFLFLIGLLPLGMTRPAALASEPHTLSLVNGDVLRGRLDHYGPNEGLQWSRDQGQRHYEFAASAIRSIDLGGQGAGEPDVRPPFHCEVELTTGEGWQGSLESLTPERAVIQTQFAGKLELESRLIRFLRPLSPEPAWSFQGPVGLEGWTMGEVQAARIDDSGVFRYRDGAFYADKAASIARDLSLPKRSVLEFDAAWRGTLSIAIALYTDFLQPIRLAEKENEPDFGGFYSLQLNSYSLNMLVVKKDEPLRYLERGVSTVLSQARQAHVRILTDSAQASVHLEINGELVMEWRDPQGWQGQGSGIRIVHQGTGSVKLGNLRVGPWDGRLNVSPTLAPDATEDRVLLHGPQVLQGKIEGFADGSWKVRMGGQERSAKWDQVALVEWAGRPLVGVNGESPAGVPVQVNLFPKGALLMMLRDWNQEALQGTDVHGDELSIRPSWVQRVDFLTARPN